MSDWYKYLTIERDEHEDQMDMERVDAILFWGLAFIVLVIPLIVRVHIGDFISPSITQTDVLDTGKKADVFTYYKFVVLLVSTAFLSLVFLYKVLVLNYQIPKTKIDIALAVLAVCLTLSAVLAPYKTLALYGLHNRHEGTLTYLCYLMLFFIASNIRYTVRRFQQFIYFLTPFIIINTILGTLNFFGYDVLQLHWVRTLLYSSLPEGAKIAQGSSFLATINHGNYVSGVSAFFVALFFCLAVLEKKIWKKILNGLIASAAFALLLSSLSSNGFVTLVLMSPLFVYMIVKAEKRKVAALSSLVLMVVFVAVYVPFVKQNHRVWDETIGFFIPYNPFQQDHQQAGLNTAFKDIEQVVGHITERVVSGSSAYADAEEYRLPKLPGPGIAPGSGRAFIWEKALELISDKPFIGYGLDTFPYFFNQDDPEKNSNLGEGYSVIVDKPHNMYIGMAFGAGIVALSALVVVMVGGAIQLLRSTRVRFNVYIAALCAALMAYVIQGMFNDSIIGTAVFFWVGLGVSIGFLRTTNKSIKGRNR
ncbi:O-antigen ligase family protein [Geobacillus sp. BMUD]|uniref:O-antigen ligase family protein n=1 Tax=Geobacillus TaxID=129337 RepID=UPI0014912D47|nr:O-antigen ligase family protein [Geobacillus sp. BMUD]NNU83847.1 O-antigen ligase family protein [Geobacillus sp. BMUD]